MRHQPPRHGVRVYERREVYRIRHDDRRLVAQRPPEVRVVRLGDRDGRVTRVALFQQGRPGGRQRRVCVAQRHVGRVEQPRHHSAERRLVLAADPRRVGQLRLELGLSLGLRGDALPRLLLSLGALRLFGILGDALPLRAPGRLGLGPTLLPLRGERAGDGLPLGEHAQPIVRPREVFLVYPAPVPERLDAMRCPDDRVAHAAQVFLVPSALLRRSLTGVPRVEDGAAVAVLQADALHREPAQELFFAVPLGLVVVPASGTTSRPKEPLELLKNLLRVHGQSSGFTGEAAERRPRAWFGGQVSSLSPVKDRR